VDDIDAALAQQQLEEQERWEHAARVHNDFQAWAIAEGLLPQRNDHAISKGSEKARKATAGAIGPERIGEDSLSASDR
jgi:hypothetical protein